MNPTKRGTTVYRRYAFISLCTNYVRYTDTNSRVEGKRATGD